MSVQLAKRLFTVEEYYKMAAAGILDEDDRVELINGEIIEMSPIGSPHMACVKCLNLLLNESLGRNYLVSVQDPISIDRFSEPEPDLAVLKFRDDFYRNHKPTQADVLLVIEVADSSIEKDRKIKIPLYAFAGISEAWLVDLGGHKITVFTHPTKEDYLQSRVYLPGSTVTSDVVKGLSVAVSDVIWTG